MPKEQLSFFQDIEKEKRKITLSLDKLYIIGVIILIGLVACFGLGVEKGRRLDFAGSDTQPAADQKVILDTSQPKEAAAILVVPIEKQAQEAQSEKPIEKKEEEKQYYSIQVASYKSPRTARVEADDLEKKGFTEVDVRPGDNWTAICVGRFKTRAEAKKLFTRLRTYYGDCYIRYINS